MAISIKKKGKEPITLRGITKKVMKEHDLKLLKSGKVKRVDKWKNEWYVEVYIQSRRGSTDMKICEMLGITYGFFSYQIKNDPALKEALDRGRKRETDSVQKYIYERLPIHLQEMWDKLERWEKNPLERKRNEHVLFDLDKSAKQNLFVHACISNGYNMSRASKMVGVPYNTIQNWMKEDEDFKKLLEEVKWHLGNFFEEGLVDLVRKGDSVATVFANRTFNRKRGYTEKQEVQITGEIQHRHELVMLEDLKLPIEVMKQVYEALQQRKKDDPKLLPKPEDVVIEGKIVDQKVEVPVEEEVSMEVELDEEKDDG